MQRYLIRVENKMGFAPEQTAVISSKLSDEVRSFKVSIKNLRISEYAIEFDTFSSDEHERKNALQAIEKKYGKILGERNLLVDSPLQSKQKTVKTSLDLFNEQRYWECHETLEQIWRKEPKGKEKDVQQGIILAASALVHSQKNEDNVCLGMIPRALAKLESWGEEQYHSFDIEKLKASLRKMEQTRKITLPRI